MFNYEEYDTTNIDDVLPNEQSVLDDSTFSADDIDNDDIDDLPANVIEEMMRAGGSLIGANQSSILKNIVEQYVKENKSILRLDWLMANRPVKTSPDNGKPYLKPICDRIRDDILMMYEECRIEVNKNLINGATRLSSLYTLPGWVVAQILISTGDVKVLNTATNENPDGSLRVIRRHYFKNAHTQNRFKWSGQWALYNQKYNNDALILILMTINPAADDKEIKNFTRQLNKAPMVYMNARKDLVFWRNGVWDYSTQTFTNYDDAVYDDLYGDVICLCKFAVNHPLGRMWGGQAPMSFDANGVLIEPSYTCHDGTVWTPSYQLQAPFEIGTVEGDASFDCYIHFMQFTLRGMNGDPGYYHIWINGYGDGTNGKGTAGDMIELLMHNLKPVPGCEDLATAPLVIPVAIDELGEDHKLNGTNLLSARFIRGQETDSTSGGSVYVKNCALPKNLARSQPEQYRDLYEMPVIITWTGGLLQECNYTPIFADKSVSMIRAILVTRFNKHFGTDKGYIKSDYILRDEVRSWIAWYITTQVPCYTSYNKASTDVLQGNANEMLKESMNSAQFFDEVLPQLPLNVIPVDLLYYMYERWCRENGLKGPQVVPKNTFTRDMQQYANMPGAAVSFTANVKRMHKEDYKAREVLNIPALERWGYDYSNTNGIIDKQSKYATTRIISLPNNNDERPIIKITTLNWGSFITFNDSKVEMKGFRNVFIRREEIQHSADDDTVCEPEKTV